MGCISWPADFQGLSSIQPHCLQEMLSFSGFLGVFIFWKYYLIFFALEGFYLTVRISPALSQEWVRVWSVRYLSPLGPRLCAGCWVDNHDHNLCLWRVDEHYTDFQSMIWTGKHGHLLNSLLGFEFIAGISSAFYQLSTLFSCHVFRLWNDLDAFQIPVAVGVSAYQAYSLYKGHRIISSKGDASTNWQVHQLVLYCCCGISAGIVGGLLGLGGGFILGPLFLELGIPPQVIVVIWLH